MSDIPVVPDGATTVIPAPAVVTPPDGDKLQVSWKEFVELKKTQRDTLAILQQMQDEKKAKAEAKAKPVVPVAASPDDAMAEVKRLTSLLEFKDALSDSGVTDPKKKAALTRMWKAEAPQDIGAWLVQTVDDLGFKSAPTTPTAQVPSLPAQVVPAPVRGTVQGVPTKINEMSEDMIRSMSPEQVHNAINATLNGPGSNLSGAHLLRSAAEAARKKRSGQ